MGERERVVFCLLASSDDLWHQNKASPFQSSFSQSEKGSAGLSWFFYRWCVKIIPEVGFSPFQAHISPEVQIPFPFLVECLPKAEGLGGNGVPKESYKCFA